MKHEIPRVLALQDAASERLERYVALLEARAVPAGLIAESDRERIFQRHVVDSLRATRLFHPSDRASVDLGSGAGLPGVVLAIAVPTCRFILVEARARRVGFLELAVQELELSNVEIVRDRVETLATTADVATARAFAPLPHAWEAAFPLLRPGGRLIYFAGEGLDDPHAAVLEIPASRRPEAVRSDRVLENATPLVIMTRG